jgi:hypothetical protein
VSENGQSSRIGFTSSSEARELFSLEFQFGGKSDFMYTAAAMRAWSNKWQSADALKARTRAQGRYIVLHRASIKNVRP